MSFDFGNLTPAIDMSYLDDQNQQKYEVLDNMTHLDEILAEQIKPMLEGNKKVVDGLNENYKKLNDLYRLKEIELEDIKTEAKKARSYNTMMLVIALVSAGIALASLVATILVTLQGRAI